MQKMHICHICGGAMYPKTEHSTYNFKGAMVTIPDVNVFRCENCGEGILEAEEVKRIEEVVVEKINCL